MAAYMKHVAPFLGVRSGPRRIALKASWLELASPTSDELGDACLALVALAEREFHYAAYDLIEKYVHVADEYFLAEYVEPLLVTTPWWDTVDGLGTTAVSPLCWRYDATDLVLAWSSSPNMWLNRAAIQHQRGWETKHPMSTSYFRSAQPTARIGSSSSPKQSAGLFATSRASTPPLYDDSCVLDPR